MSYAFENEAYRSLPAVLKEKYGIEVKERIIRAEIGGSEINIFCKAERKIAITTTSFGKDELIGK